MKRSLKYQPFDERELLPVTDKEKRILLIKSVFVVLILNYFFYRSVLAFLPLSLVALWYYRLEKEILRKKKREEVRGQFKELLLLVSNGQKAGYSAENAFLSSYQEMEGLYGKGSSICRMLRELEIARENGKSLPEIWYRIGEKTGILEIQEFAQVYKISHEKSGNVAATMEKTAKIIAEKVDAEKEIAVLLSARRMEQKIMNAMPFSIMLYVGLTSPGYFDGLYHTLAGMVIMSICLGIYLLSYGASLKIIDIRL